MATSVTIRPDDPRAVAFRWMVDRLQSNPDLRRHVSAWQVWDGSPQADDPPSSSGVTVRLTPAFEAEEPDCVLGGGRVRVSAPVTVKIEARVMGRQADNAINLAGLIESAAWPAADADRLAMNAAGVSWLEPGEPAAQAGDGIVSKGSFRMMVFITRG